MGLRIAVGSPGCGAFALAACSVLVLSGCGSDAGSASNRGAGPGTSPGGVTLGGDHGADAGAANRGDAASTVGGGSGGSASTGNGSGSGGASNGSGAAASGGAGSGSNGSGGSADGSSGSGANGSGANGSGSSASGGGRDASAGGGPGSGGNDGGSNDATVGGGGIGDAGAPGSRDGSGARVYPPFASATGSVADGIAQLNAYRALVGLGQVTLDPVSSIGCAAHVAYLQCAAKVAGTQGYLEHSESKYAMNCAMDGGAQAGIESDLAFGQSSSGRQGVVGQSLGQAVDGWINGVYHRTPLLDPGLVKVGAASSQGYNCLDYAAPGNTVAMRAASPVLFPPDGTTDVPDTFEGNEGPCPTQPSDPGSATSCPGSGFIVSANWYGWTTRGANAISQVASVTLSDVTAGTSVALLTWYADTISGHDPLPGYVRDEIVLVPAARLAANHTFAVQIDATIARQAVSTTWQFTTGTRAP